MIFVTVGTDGPFDRLVAAVDRWAGENGRTDVVAQIGRSDLEPRYLRWYRFLEPPQFHEYLLSAEVVIGHAGMGTILSALRYEKPLLVMPRRASLGEQRNEHQLATARHLQEAGKVHVAFTEAELISSLAQLEGLIAAGARIGPDAEPRLLTAIHEFIDPGAFGGIVEDSPVGETGGSRQLTAPGVGRERSL